MLVLTRKCGQKIHVGQSVTITILRVKGNQVRVGIEAPSGVRVLRAELVNGTADSHCSDSAEPTLAIEMAPGEKTDVQTVDPEAEQNPALRTLRGQSALYTVLMERRRRRGMLHAG